MSIDSEILNHFNSNWDQSPTIIWTSQNVSANIDADTEYVVPRVIRAFSAVQEVPYDEGIVRYDYQFYMNLLLKENSGVAKMYACETALRSIYHKKTVTTSNYSYSFDTLEVLAGYMTGAHFEVPIYVTFYTFTN